MAVLKNNAYIPIVWGAKNNFIMGLNPLGLQNTSEATYATILSGITNLTNRIRYYGFYCWLLEYYAHYKRYTYEILFVPVFTDISDSRFRILF
jgi:hypothetical protein